MSDKGEGERQEGEGKEKTGIDQVAMGLQRMRPKPAEGCRIF